MGEIFWVDFLGWNFLRLNFCILLISVRQKKSIYMLEGSVPPDPCLTSTTKSCNIFSPRPITVPVIKFTPKALAFVRPHPKYQDARSKNGKHYKRNILITELLLHSYTELIYFSYVTLDFVLKCFAVQSIL